MLPYPAAKLFALVNDVERYPEFLPWCAAAEVVSTKPGEMLAALVIRRGALSERFTTRNAYSFPERIEMSLVEGPFERLSGAWKFTTLGEGCKVELDLEFEYARGFLHRAIGSAFGRAASSLVDAFCTRARTLYQ